MGFVDDSLSWITHYQLPAHPLDEDGVFEEPAQHLLRVWALLRTNALLLLRELATGFPGSSTVRIWPHHFDTGLLLPVRHSGDGTLLGYLSAGLAPRDSIAGEPYLYLTGWHSEEGELDFPTQGPLKAGQWATGDWKGAFLTLSHWLHADDQYALGRQFFRESSQALREAFTAA